MVDFAGSHIVGIYTSYCSRLNINSPGTGLHGEIAGLHGKRLRPVERSGVFMDG